MSIATGLMNSLSQRISDRITYLEKKREADREYLMTYGTRAVRDTEAKANAVIAQGKFLEGMGMSPEKVDYVVTKYGIPALSELYEAVKSNQYTKEDLNGGELLNNMVTFADDYETDEFSWEDFTRRSFGLYKDADKSTPANRASGWFHSLLGLNPRTADPDTYIGGYTEADIRRIMGTSAPTLTSAPTYDIYGTLPKRYTPTQMAAYKSTIEDSLDTYAENWLAANAIKEGQTYSEDFMATYNAIEKAVATKSDSSYAYLAQVIPDAKQYILSIDKNSRGVVQQAAKQGFMSQGFLNIFEGAKAAAADTAGGVATTGAGDSTIEVTTLPDAAKAPEPPATDVSFLNTAHTQAKQKYPDIASLDDLPRFDTQEEFISAGVEFGIVGTGTSARIGRNASAVKSTDQQDDLEATSDKTTDLGDMTGAPGFRDPELTVEERIKDKREATTQVVGAISDAAENVSSKLKALDSTLDKVAGDAVLGIRSKANTALGALAQIAGYDELADSFYRVSVEAEDGTRKGVRFDQGLVTGINEILDDLGVADFSKLKEEGAVNQYLDDPNTKGRDLSADLGIGYEPATIRLYSAMDRLKKLRLAVNQSPEDVTPEAVVEALTKPEQGKDVVYTIEEIKAYAENRLGARERQAMEDRIRDDARQFLQDEKSFPQPLPTIVIEKLEDDIVEEAKVDVEVMRIVQQLDKKGGVPSRKDIEDLKTALELNQEIDTETQELYRGPISGKTLVEKLDDIYNFYNAEEADFNPRAVGTVGFRDLGLRDTTDDVRPPRDKGPELGDEPDSLENPESELGFFTKPRNMMVESMLTRGKRVPADELEGPEGEESGLEVSTGSMYTDMAELIERVHGGGSKFTQLADDIADAAIRGDKVKVADITRLINATEKLRSTKTRSEVLRSLYAMRDRLNKR